MRKSNTSCVIKPPQSAMWQPETKGGLFVHLAPEGRHVYRIHDTPNNQSPRGATCEQFVKREL